MYLETTTPQSSGNVEQGHSSAEKHPLVFSAPHDGELALNRRNDLVLENMNLVHFVARGLQRRMPQHVQLEDLLSAGAVGLVDAVNRFNVTREVKFKSYAQIRIRGAMLDSLRATDWGPRELRRQGRAIAQAMQVLSSRLGRVPTDEEVSEQMGLSLHTYQQLTGDLKGLQLGSLNLERSEEGEEEELAFLAAPDDDNPLTQLVGSERRQVLTTALAELPEKERLVLALYYFEEMTMKEIGLTLGVVESRVSQLRSAALNRLRRRLGASTQSSKIKAKPNCSMQVRKKLPVAKKD